MPTYEYQCRSCRRRFDAFQSITASPLTRCPHCRKKVDRLISAGAGFLFKGAGFYTTDYRSKPYQEAAKKDREGSPAAPLAAQAPSKGDTGHQKVEAKHGQDT
jgi:putative FmdB family regulatory protein